MQLNRNFRKKIFFGCIFKAINLLYSCTMNRKTPICAKNYNYLNKCRKRNHILRDDFCNFDQYKYK